MGILWTVVVGLIVGIVGRAIGWYQAGAGAGFIASVVVAIVLLVIHGRTKDGK